MDDKKLRRKNQWEAYLRKNNNQAEIEPIDYFYPNATNLKNTLVGDGTVNGKKTYARILVQRQRMAKYGRKEEKRKGLS